MEQHNEILDKLNKIQLDIDIIKKRLDISHEEALEQLEREESFNQWAVNTIREGRKIENEINC